jgi:hypothetical protein
MKTGTARIASGRMPARRNDRKEQPPSGSAAVFQQLREVLRRNPSLAGEVREAQTPEAASDALARIGALHGIPTSAVELRGHVTRVLAAAHSRASPVPIADEVLDRMTGGAAPQELPWKSILEKLLS